MLMLPTLLLGLAGFTAADLPVECHFEDVRGTWTFSETERTGDNTINCDALGPIVHTKTFTLSFPNIVKDELHNQGTWTLISTQGFEVNINERSYFAFFYYEGDWVASVSYCNRTLNGWSRDRTVRNWSCFTGHKTTAVSMGYTVQEMFLRSGGNKLQTLPPPVPPPTSHEERVRVSLLPDHFDWRDVDGVNYVSDVRDQQSCGSCFIFASMAMLEARLRIATRNQRQDVFSVQDVVSCSNLSQGCDGGFKYLIGGRYAQEQGVVAEECNLYTGIDDQCDTDASCSRTYVSEYSFLGGYYGGGSEDLIMEALVKNGPLAVSYMVYSDFHSYSGGIYHYTGLREDFDPYLPTNHAVLIVGYGADSDTGEKYWIVKNSWGADWGEDGYFRIRRGTNECNIGSFAVEATPIP